MNLLLLFLLGDTLVISWGCLSIWNSWQLAQGPGALGAGAAWKWTGRLQRAERAQRSSLSILDSFLVNLRKLICSWHLIIAHHRTSDVFVRKLLHFRPHLRPGCIWQLPSFSCSLSTSSSVTVYVDTDLWSTLITGMFHGFHCLLVLYKCFIF